MKTRFTEAQIIGVLTEAQKAKLLSDIPVDEVWGVGRRLVP